MSELLGLGQRPFVIGMVHLQALPGSPGFAGDLAAVRDAALRDAQALTTGGVDAILVENFFDAPFFPGEVPVETTAHMTRLVGAIVDSVDRPVGVNVLRNDGCAALAVAQAAGATFVRVNVLTGARLTDQGIVHGIAHQLLRARRALDAESIRIFADVDVKHSAALGDYPLEQEIDDLVTRGRADAVVVSGSGTGQPTDLEGLRRARAAVRAVPLIVGSGVTAETIGELAQHTDGFIVGSAIKDADGAISATGVTRLMSRLADAVPSG